MRLNRFLANAGRGAENPVLQLVAIAITWLSFMVLGGSLLLVPLMVLMVQDPARADAYMANPLKFELLGWNMTVIFALIMGQFVVGLGGIWVSETLVLRKKLVWVFSGFKRYRWGRMFSAMGLWMGMMVLYQAITYLLDPSSVSVVLDPARFFTFLPVALIMVPLQSAFEEVAIRGQLLQALSRTSPRQPWVPLVVTSFVFAALHWMNAEVQEYGLGLMMAHYLTFGLMLGAFAIMDEGLEMSIGIHAGNNVFSLCFVSYKGSSLSTPTILQQESMMPVLDYLVMIGFVAVMYVVYLGKRKGATRALVENISTSPAQPGDEEEMLKKQEEFPFA